MFTVLLALAASVTEAGHHKGHHHKSHVNSWDYDGSPVTKLLKGAINRGVPMYNMGWHKSCAMVYETALHALVVGEWGLSMEDMETLEEGFDKAKVMTSSSAKAWAYRHLMDDVLKAQKSMTESPEPKPEETEAPAPAPMKKKKMMLFDFESADDSAYWDVILDGVMGGKSTGNIETRGGALVFAGTTSLANNGGFSSIRAPITPGSLAGMETLRMKVKGDGRTYIVSTRANDNFGYWTRFTTVKGEWTTFDVKISQMEKHWYGMRRPGRINPEQIQGLEFYINDKQEGSFKLKVDWVKAMN